MNHRNASLLAILFLMSLGPIMAQTKKFVPGVWLAPGLSWQKYLTRSDSAYLIQSAESSSSQMRPLYSPSFGVLGNWFLTKNVGLKVGIGINRKGGQSRPSSTSLPGTPEREEIKLQRSYTYKHYFLTLPIQIQHQLKLGGLAFHAGAGLLSELYLTTKTTEEINLLPNNLIEKTSHTEPFHGFRRGANSLILKLGYSYRQSNTSSLTLDSWLHTRFRA